MKIRTPVVRLSRIASLQSMYWIEQDKRSVVTKEISSYNSSGLNFLRNSPLVHAFLLDLKHGLTNLMSTNSTEGPPHRHQPDDVNTLLQHFHRAGEGDSETYYAVSIGANSTPMQSKISHPHVHACRMRDREMREIVCLYACV